MSPCVSARDTAVSIGSVLDVRQAEADKRVILPSLDTIVLGSDEARNLTSILEIMRKEEEGKGTRSLSPLTLPSSKRARVAEAISITQSYAKLVSDLIEDNRDQDSVEDNRDQDSVGDTSNLMEDNHGRDLARATDKCSDVIHVSEVIHDNGVIHDTIQDTSERVCVLTGDGVRTFYVPGCTGEYAPIHVINIGADDTAASAHEKIVDPEKETEKEKEEISRGSSGQEKIICGERDDSAIASIHTAIVSIDCEERGDSAIASIDSLLRVNNVNRNFLVGEAALQPLCLCEL